MNLKLCCTNYVLLLTPFKEKALKLELNLFNYSKTNYVTRVTEQNHKHFMETFSS